MSSPLVHPRLNKIDSYMKKMMKYMEKYQYLGEGEIYCRNIISFRYETIKKGEYRLYLRKEGLDIIIKIVSDSAKFLKTAKAFNNKMRIAEIEKFFVDVDKELNIEKIVKTNSPFFELQKVLDKIKKESYIGRDSQIERINVDSEFYIKFFYGNCELFENEDKILEYSFPYNNSEFGKFSLSKKFKNFNNIKLNKKFYDGIARKLTDNNTFEFIKCYFRLKDLLSKFQLEFIHISKDEFDITDKLKIGFDPSPNLNLNNKISISKNHLKNAVVILAGENQICVYCYNKIEKKHILQITQNSQIYNYQYLKDLCRILEEYYPKFLEEIKDIYSLS